MRNTEATAEESLIFTVKYSSHSFVIRKILFYPEAKFQQVIREAISTPMVFKPHTFNPIIAVFVTRFNNFIFCPLTVYLHQVNMI